MTTGTKKRRIRRRVRRKPLLAQLPPQIQQACYQELLDQGALFRQISAAANGVPGPIERNVIPDIEIDEEIDEEIAVEDQEQSVEPSPVSEPPPSEPSPVSESPPPEVEPSGDKGEQSPPGLPGISKEQVKELLVADKKHFKKLMIGGAAVVIASALLGAGALKWLSPESPPTTDPSIVTTNDESGQATVIETDEQLLEILVRSGYTIPSTDLSNTADREYHYDPKLRARHLRELQEAFDRNP